MIKTSEFYNTLIENGIDSFYGVPDSLLKDFCAYIADNAAYEKNVITANEGNALAMAAGHYLVAQKPAVVYMQNSGLGNIVNPLLSLTDEEVYAIPVLLVIGWRGEPNVHDEPQHIKQGKLTLPLLEVMGVRYEILDSMAQVSLAFEYMRETGKPFALIVRKGTFSAYSYKVRHNESEFVREDAVKMVLSLLGNRDIVVSTTGMISRELYENRSSHEKDFLTVGSMGHASSIAFGIALERENRKVFCFDGDGAFLMHMGAGAVIASRKLKNFRHIVFNNAAHDSVGGQPTVAEKIDLPKIAAGSGYIKTFSARTSDELKSVWTDFYEMNGPSLLEIKVKCGARENLGRPKEKPVENKNAFMAFLKD